MNRRLVLTVPAAALLIGLGAFAVPASAQTVPAPYTTNTPAAPDEGVLDNVVTDGTDGADGADGADGTNGTNTSGTNGTGTNTSGTNGTGTNTSGTNTSGTNTSGTNAGGSRSTGNGSGSLPFTGTESMLVLGLAAGALTTGVVLVGLGRRRATV